MARFEDSCRKRAIPAGVRDEEHGYLRNGAELSVDTEFSKKGAPSPRSSWKSLAVCVGLAVVALVLCLVAFDIHYDELNKNTGENSIAERFKYLSVVAQNSKCSQIGMDMVIGHGGSAVDAAIATSFCSGILHGPWMGLGGGTLLVIYERPNTGGEKEMVTLVGREKVPLGATRDMFSHDPDASFMGGLAIAVPGEVKALQQAWKRYGRVNWSTLIQPSIKIAEEGFRIPGGYHRIIRTMEEYLRQDPGMSALYVKPSGELLSEGDILRLPKLARTLRVIADEGADAFYNGSLTDDIVADIQEHGGIVTKRDLNEYTAPFKPPTVSKLNNGKYTLYGAPFPSSSVLTQFVLNVLDGYNISPSDLENSEATGLRYHRIAEAVYFGYGEKKFLVDEDYDDYTKERQKLLTNLTFGETVRKRIDDQRTHEPDYYFPNCNDPEDDGTHQLSVYTPDGASVSMTSSLNLWFGANRIGSRTGIIFNNNMRVFSNPAVETTFPYAPNSFIEPGKRPKTSMAPLLVFDDQDNFVLSAGSAGSRRILPVTVLNIVGILWLKQSLEDATHTPRLYPHIDLNQLFIDPGFDQEIILELEKRGHVVEVLDTRPTASAAILKKHSAECPNPGVACLQAACDTRYRGQCRPQGY